MTVPNKKYHWPNKKPSWSEPGVSLVQEFEFNPPFQTRLNEVIENSSKFPLEFPISSVRCETLIKTVPVQILQRNINSTYPILHEHSLRLYGDFLQHKRKFGSNIEREFYKNCTLKMLVDRLLTKRAAVFVDESDSYMLLDGTKGAGNWETIGTRSEKPPLVLENCLSYDEMKLSALLSVSSFTCFINNGNRDNEGEPANHNVENDGIIIGLIGARFEKYGVMEYQDIIVNAKQNTQANGYGKCFVPTMRGLFMNFYEHDCLAFDEMEDLLTDKAVFKEIRHGVYFNKMVYGRRLALSIDTLLIEASARAKAENKMAYIHVVGFGLGVWRTTPYQDFLFMEIFVRRVGWLRNQLRSISDICFSYMNCSTSYKDKIQNSVPVNFAPLQKIKIHKLNREPHEKLRGEHEGKLLVVSYAWDGNSLPGNEFWMGQLNTSGDPAAASSTQIAELHNAHINPQVCADNLRIATIKGIVSFREYQQLLKS
ncbi:uncharacterized protein LOC132705416 [Cylas formicarius]|uniref:uncharacterized protein LOC132705416 n=1 Tax=Cylas formicarius TaxID=197179 RepID=UPI0029585E51|nr:uncharacterized protein LOC132705416 [Cylas formicarius]